MIGVATANSGLNNHNLFENQNKNFDNNNEHQGAWRQQREYKYKVQTRTLTALPELAQQWAGVVTRARLSVRPQSANTLVAKVSQAEYATVHQTLQGGWEDQEIDENQLGFRPLPLSKRPFQIQLKNGAIHSLDVDRTMTNEEVNQLKGIVSQLQVDTNAQNEIKCKYNQLPSSAEANNAVYKTMEPTVTGKCETIYDISPLPEYLTQSHRDWVPMPELKQNGQFLDIVKTKNYSNCDERMGYHFGITGNSNLKPGTNQMGDFLAKSQVTRVIVFWLTETVHHPVGSDHQQSGCPPIHVRPTGSRRCFADQHDPRVC